MQPVLQHQSTPSRGGSYESQNKGDGIHLVQRKRSAKPSPVKALNIKKEANQLNLDLCSLMSKEKIETQNKMKGTNEAQCADGRAIHVYKAGNNV